MGAISQLAATAEAGRPIEVQLNPDLGERNVEPWESLNFDVTVVVEPSSTSMVALRATTDAGSVMTDILEIRADSEARTYLL